MGKSLAKKVDDIAKATMKVCVFACFPAGTPVHTKDGIKSIEDIQVGDLVWAYNEETGETALQEVTATMQREVDATVYIELEGETIETTAEHPFYTQDGWKDAADLMTSDVVQTKNNEWKQVKGQDFSYEPKRVFNFEVAHWHTYFVGLLAWLVHNAKVCITGAVKKISNRLKYMGRTPGKNSKTGREVFERMMKEKPPKARIKNGKKQFKSKKDNKWYDIDKADMSHKRDAVDWWNKVARKKGYKPKGDEVREWMRKQKNYYLEHKTYNRSAGGKIKQTYKPPIKK